MRGDVQKIFLATPHAKQVMMFSATYSEEAKRLCGKFTTKAHSVLVDDDHHLTLRGVHQFYETLGESDKNRHLGHLLDTLEFHQVVVFVRSGARAKALCGLLSKAGYEAIFLHGRLRQAERIARYKKFKTFQARVLVSTDLVGRGIDIQRVNVVINYDMPRTADAYLHRVGRAGRFGTKGLAVSFVVDGSDDEGVLMDVQTRFMKDGKVMPMGETIDVSLYKSA